MINNSLQPAAWDSSFFGYPIGKIIADTLDREELHQMINEAREKDWELLYLFTKPTDMVSNESAVSEGANLVDRKITFYTKIDKGTDVEIDEHIQEYNAIEPSQKLIDLAIQSGLYSRYKTDTNFKNNEFEKLYHTWIINSVNKKIADHTLVYVEDGQEQGFVTLKLDGTFGQIGLIAVDEGSRGKSIGKKLVHAVVALLKKENIFELEVATQVDNADACNFYRKVGFTANKTDNVYHIWL